MADYRKLIPIILKWEGGYGNHPLDKGGPTMKGVTLSTFQSFFGKDKTVEDLKNITDAQWGHIFKSGFWDKMKADNYINQSVANILVDWAYNSGVTTAVKQLQRILNVNPDGKIGPITLSKLNYQDQHSLFDSIWSARKSFYEGIVARKPSQKVFLKGWLNRLNSFKFGS